MSINDTPLGKKTEYKDSYDASLLFPISREPLRNSIIGQSNLKADSSIFKGFDIWNCYEFSWLNSKGKPEVRILEFVVPAISPNIVESKSVKLYLNSFHNTRFVSEQEVIALLKKDLSDAVSAEVNIVMKNLVDYSSSPLSDFEGQSIDDLDIQIDDFLLNRNILRINDQVKVSETLTSNLLKANCLVTGQPDWGSVQIKYEGSRIDRESLLRYILSFRKHNEFAEPWVERAFIDIMDLCKPEFLQIHTRFTRRGGIDINPVRSTLDLNVTEINNFRHIRQ
jgi:7-cyano-7-deazaguanine reductase